MPDACTIHVCVPRGYFVGQVRGIGCRKWRTVTGRCRDPRRALARAVCKMARDDKRARVLFIDRSGWYEPNLVMRASRG